MQSPPQPPVDVHIEDMTPNAKVEICVNGVWSRGIVIHTKCKWSSKGLILIGVEQSDDCVFITPPFTGKIRNISEDMYEHYKRVPEVMTGEKAPQITYNAYIVSFSE